MDLTKISDEQIVDKVRQGDNESYSEIVKRYKDKLLRYIRRLSYNSNEAEDILQDVFIKAYKNLYSFNIKKKFSSWIYRIAHNETINHIKKNKREKAVMVEIDFDVADKIDLNKELISKDLKKELSGYISKLKLKYRESIILHYFEEKSYEEISDILRIPTSSVGTLIHRAKKKLKKICQKK